MKAGSLARGRNFLRGLLLFATAWISGAHGTDSRTASLATLSRPTIAIEDVSIVDVIRGEVESPRTILIVDGLIAAIGESGAVEFPPGTARVPGRDLFLIPGLVDMHVHLFNNASRRPPNEWAFPLFIANGVTAVREMSTEPAEMAIIQAWRSKMESGELVAPRILAAGAVVRTESASAVGEQVQASKAAGVDFLKVFSDMREPVWRALLGRGRGRAIAGVRTYSGRSQFAGSRILRAAE